jgi:fumarate hydratase, class I
MPEFAYQDPLPMGEDTTSYRLPHARGRVREHRRPAAVPRGRARGSDAADSRGDAGHRPHLFRPGHLRQLADILRDPEASANDRFVALELLKNACVAAGGVLPSCQDTGTAIVMGKKGERVLSGGDDEPAIA